MENVVACLILFQICHVLSQEQETDMRIQVDCGTVKTDHVNISYFGEVSRIYSTTNELECTSVEKDLTHKLYNVNNRPECGVKWDNTSMSFTLHVRVQMQPYLVTEDDQVYVITCDYSPNKMTNQRVSVILYEDFMARRFYTQQVQTTMVETLQNAFHVYIRSSTSERGLIASPVAGDAVYVQIHNPSWIEETLKYMFVEECMIRSTDATPTFSLQFLSLGCGTGSVIPRHLYFDVSEDGAGLRSPTFLYPKLPDTYEYAVIVCSVYLSYPVKPTNLSEICPIGRESNGTYVPPRHVFQFPNLEREGVTSLTGALTSTDPSKVKDLHRHLSNSEKQELLAVLQGMSSQYLIDNGELAGTAQNETVRYVNIVGSAASTKESAIIDSSVHYLIITCVLSFLLIVFALLNLCLIRLLMNRRVECCEGCTMEHRSCDDTSRQLFEPDCFNTKM